MFTTYRETGMFVYTRSGQGDPDSAQNIEYCLVCFLDNFADDQVSAAASQAVCWSRLPFVVLR